MFLSLRTHTRRYFLCAAAVPLVAISFWNTSVASPLAIGSVEQVDPNTSSIVVLGQQYRLDAGTLLTSEAAYPSRLALADFAPNTLVLVDGRQDTTGSFHVDALIALADSNIPGASQLLVAGVVTGVSNIGQIRIGQLKVDVTPTLASSSSSPAVGDFVEVSGTQPQSKGVFLAQSVVHTQGVVGTGHITTMGVGGTGRVTAAGVGGTGKVTLNGVGGTGRVIAAGVGGTGKLSPNGVGGTGRIIAAGVGGTGKLSPNGVGGTGRVIAAGVGGTGKVTLNGVGGTGRVIAAGVGGTGKVTTAGVGGTG